MLSSGVFRISKRGAKFSLATSAHTKEGATKFFQFFFNVKKKIFWPKGGHGPMAPLKYASDAWLADELQHN